MYKQILQFHQKGLAKIHQGVVIRVLFRSNKAKGDRIIGRPLNLATGENPGGIPVNQQGRESTRPLPDDRVELVVVGISRMDDRDGLVGNGIDRAEHVETLSSTRRFDPNAFHAPHKRQKCTVDEMRCIDKKDRTLTSFRFIQSGLQVFLLNSS